MNELFTEKRWGGEFFLPDQYEQRFSGTIDYSPEDGVILSYSVTGIKHPEESDVIHGVLDSGEKCTLVGKFLSKNAGIRSMNGLTTRPGRVAFSFLLIGDLVAHDKLFFELDFSLTNMQEFFFPKGYIDLVKYSKKPLLSLKTSYGKIEVGNNVSFGLLSNDITAQIYSRNDAALQELKKSFEEITAKHPDSNFMFKKDLAYRISLKIKPGSTILNAYNYITDISNLFAILIYSPVHPESINIVEKVNGKYPFQIKVFPSMRLDKRTRELSTGERSHFHMPIRQNNINLGSILNSWIKTPKKYSTLVSSIQTETGFTDEHSLYGEIVLYATQLESISHEKGIGNRQKYEYPLNTYGSDKIRSGILNIFKKVGKTDIGKGVGELRDEIAHVGKPKKLLQSLTPRDIIYISAYLRMTIIGYVLKNLGIKKGVIEDYQNKFTPRDV